MKRLITALAVASAFAGAAAPASAGTGQYNTCAPVFRYDRHLGTLKAYPVYHNHVYSCSYARGLERVARNVNSTIHYKGTTWEVRIFWVGATEVVSLYAPGDGPGNPHVSFDRVAS